MIQDIAPSKLDNSFGKYTPDETDTVFAFDEGGALFVKTEESGYTFPILSDLQKGENVYLFSIDDRRYFLRIQTFSSIPGGFESLDIRRIRDTGAGSELFAAFTAYHLWKWYDDNRLCPRCGKKLTHSDKERALCCTSCSNIIYPRINPAVIVGVLKDDRILVTRYNRGYSHNALIAGFCEIGETLEETVAREVMEEAGIRVCNIRYYKSQPWGMAQDLLVGFFCDAQGDDEIRMDEGELKYAAWTTREDLELQPNNLSLTNEMMRMFKENRL